MGSMMMILATTIFYQLYNYCCFKIYYINLKLAKHPRHYKEAGKSRRASRTDAHAAAGGLFELLEVATWAHLRHTKVAWVGYCSSGGAVRLIEPRATRV